MATDLEVVRYMANSVVRTNIYLSVLHHQVRALFMVVLSPGSLRYEQFCCA